jgi:hypothetical protein
VRRPARQGDRGAAGDPRGDGAHHVNNIKAKTGCASSVDIVKQVSRVPPMVTALRGRRGDRRDRLKRAQARPALRASA